MAEVRLAFYDLDADDLPDVCMRCGEPSTVRPVKSFSWTPPWPRFVKRRRVPIPLCDRHKGHWFMPRLIGYGGAGLLVWLIRAGSMTIVVDAGNNPGGEAPLINLLLFAMTGALLITWLITMTVLALTRINAVEITNDTITLENVHSEFCRAYRQKTWGVKPDLDEIVREKWGQSSGGRAPENEDAPPDDEYRRG